MRIIINSSFADFLKELDTKVQAIESDSSLPELEKQNAVRKQRRLSYALASQSFYVEVKEILNRFGILLKFDEISDALTKRLESEKIKYNIYDELRTIQIIRPSGLEHQRFIETDVLVRSLGGVAGIPELNILSGFVEDRKINEILQLAVHVVPSSIFSRQP